MSGIVVEKTGSEAPSMIEQIVTSVKERDDIAASSIESGAMTAGVRASSAGIQDFGVSGSVGRGHTRPRFMGWRSCL